MNLKKQQEFLIDALTSQYIEEDDISNNIYVCENCNHTNKIVYNGETFPTVIIGRVGHDTIKLNLFYSQDYKILREIIVEYGFDENLNRNMDHQDDDIYYAETEEDIANYADYNSDEHNFYFVNGTTIKKLTFTIELKFGYTLFGGYIYTYDNDKKYFPFDTVEEWIYIHIIWI